MIAAAFLCLVAQVHDGDSFRCEDGTRVRIAGIEANELKGGCHIDRCAALPGPRARDVVRGMIRGRQLQCTKVGMSYKRVVATCRLDGRDVGCMIVRSGAAVEWAPYQRRYGLRRC